MSQFDKLLKRFLQRPSDFTYAELHTLLTHLGYEEDNKGCSSGSRVLYIRGTQKILLHAPHNPPVLKKYMIDHIIEKLRGYGDIE